MLKTFLGSAIALALMIASPVLADEPGNPGKPQYTTSHEQWPIVCSDDPAVFQRQLNMGFIPQWQGITDEKVLSTLLVRSDGAWLFDLSLAGTGITCVLVGGQKNGLVGDEADAS